MVVEIKKVEELSDKVIRPEIKDQHKGEYVVMDDFVVFSFYKDIKEAEHIASLLKKVHEFSTNLESYIDQMLSDMTEEEKEFLIKYAGKLVCYEIK